MIDAIYLFFIEISMDRCIQLLGRLEIVAEWFFDNEACPAGAFVQAGIAQTVDGWRKRRRAQGQVEYPVARKAGFRFNLFDLLVQILEIFRGAFANRLEVEAALGPFICAAVYAADKLLDGFTAKIAVRLI